MSEEVAKVKSVEELLILKSKRSDEEVKRLLYNAAWNFHGDINDLITAAGCLTMGRLFGWRVIRLVYSAKRYSQLQNVLSCGMEDGRIFKFADWMKDEERLSYKSLGLWIVKKTKRFWDVVRGTDPVDIEQRRALK